MNALINQLYWREPLWLLLSLFPLAIMLWEKMRRQYSLQQYADKNLLPWVTLSGQINAKSGQKFIKILIWFLFSVAASGPQLLISTPDDLIAPTNAAIIVVDHSRSMLANDSSPGRKLLANSMVKQWAQQKHNLQLGLIIFSGASHIVLPATSDQQAFYETAALLNSIQLPTYGNAITDAITQAESLLTHVSGARAIIVLTDGDLDLDDKNDAKFSQLNKRIKALQRNNISLHLLGVGSLSATPLADATGRWLYHNNEAVITRLNEDKLQVLAENPDVEYQRLDPTAHKQLSNIWQGSSSIITKKDREKSIWKELFFWPLCTAMLLIVFNQLSLPRHLLKRILVFVFFCSCITLTIKPQSSYAAALKTHNTEIFQQAFQAWQKQDFNLATKLYSQVEGYTARMGEGASYFRAQEINCAIRAFSRAAWLASNDLQRGQAAFNLGNSFFKLGDFKSAVNLFEDALRYQPNQSSYQNNLDFSREVLHNIERQLLLESKRNNKARTGSGPGDTPVDVANERVSSMGIESGKTLSHSLLQPSKNFSLSNQDIALYMQRNQTFARLSSGTQFKNQQQHDWSRFTNDNPQAAHKIEFWQRLFELEEDIPAHPDSPKVLQGVRPW